MQSFLQNSEEIKFVYDLKLNERKLKQKEQKLVAPNKLNCKVELNNQKSVKDIKGFSGKQQSD